MGSELREDRSCLVMLPQGEEDAADVKEILLRDIFEMSLGEDDTGETIVPANGQAAMKYDTLKSSRDTAACGQTECYLFHVPQCTQPVSFLLRWMVDALGGSKGRNVIGRSAMRWRNLAARYLAETLVADAAAESVLHLGSSSWADLMNATRSEASSRVQAGDQEQSDYHCSPFCLLVLLVKFAIEDKPKHSRHPEGPHRPFCLMEEV